MTLWAMFLKTLGPVIRTDCLAHTTYLNIFSDYVHPFMGTVFSNGNGFPQDNAPWYTAKIAVVKKSYNNLQ